MIIEETQIDNIAKLNKTHTLGLGFFDGIHLGHTKIIELLVAHAKKHNTIPTILTFSNSPKQVLNLYSDHKYITPFSKKMKLLKDLGIMCVIIIPFTKDFSQVSADQFLNDYLLKLKVDTIFAGLDFKFGANQIGDITYLKNYLIDNNLNITLNPVDFVNVQGEKISTTNIIRLIKSGDFENIHQLLNRPYSINGTVVHGLGIGKKIGYPTANLDILNDFFLPASGVYAVKVIVNNETFDAMANVGVAPTIKDKSNEKTIEINIFNFDKDIYGEDIEVFWYKKIRDEQKFSTVDLLIEQLSKDKIVVQKYFN